MVVRQSKDIGSLPTFSKLLFLVLPQSLAVPPVAALARRQLVAHLFLLLVALHALLNVESSALPRESLRSLSKLFRKLLALPLTFVVLLNDPSRFLLLKQQIGLRCRRTAPIPLHENGRIRSSMLSLIHTIQPALPVVKVLPVGWALWAHD